jgi:thioredoxin reductase
MMQTVSTPHFLQGPEVFPAEEVRQFYSDVAKNAAIVSVRISSGRKARSEYSGDSAHMAIWDGEDAGVQNYVEQAIEGVHCMGSLVYAAARGLGSSDDGDVLAPYKKLEDQGVDVVSMRGVKDFSDQKAVAAAIEKMQAVRNGTGLTIITAMEVLEPGVSRNMRMAPDEEMTGRSLEQAILQLKMFEGSVDIVVLQAAGGITNHPNSLNQEKGRPWPLRYASAIKDSGLDIITAPNGGFRDPDENEAFIARGQTDMVAMARAFISDPDYVRKALSGEETTPCIMCNKCHGTSFTKEWYSVCSVNPKLGITTAVKSIDPPGRPRKVAVIGGGPAGMKAAITAAERGHQVTLYEKHDQLGGLLRHADYSPLQWALKDFKDYLVRQVYRVGVDVKLGTAAVPDSIKAKGYDTVLAAVGAEANVPRIPGADGNNVFNIVDVYNREKSLGKKVVLIGSGVYGVETAMFLCKMGHEVTALSSSGELMERGGAHDLEALKDLYARMPGFSYILEATPVKISKGKVVYRDSGGKEKTIDADAVVIYAGLKAKMTAALEFSGTAPQFRLLGDCTGKGGNLQKTLRNAFFTASQV